MNELRQAGNEKNKNKPFFNSALFDEKTFYQAFLEDLSAARTEVIIESPYVTSERMKLFRSLFKKLVDTGLKVYVITRSPEEHEGDYFFQAEQEIAYFEQIGVHSLLCVGNHHRKLAILDRKILWEGSLNILSQKKSREIMRRIDDKRTAMEMFEFLNLEKYL